MPRGIMLYKIAPACRSMSVCEDSAVRKEMERESVPSPSIWFQWFQLSWRWEPTFYIFKKLYHSYEDSS